MWSGAERRDGEVSIRTDKRSANDSPRKESRRDNNNECKEQERKAIKTEAILHGEVLIKTH